ncbi:hypothetical protein Scep_006201 [Stephania cephalantha]|uniref:Uncharacterized protein n=1 Tax=Stephania cephalantha TaxID=152367 RepID=A0AAP0PM00_9MAGN
MRIRKHARLLSSSTTTTTSTPPPPPPPHNVVCELNMSPWDVISPDDDDFPIQVGVDDDIMGNSSTVGER